MATISQKKLKDFKIFYYQQKLSAPEIAKKLNTSLDAVYYFMRRNRLPRRSFREQNLVRFENKKPSFVLKACNSISDKELRASGAMLYWGEGFQSDAASNVDFANSKPEMISLFLLFLRRICGIDESKLRAYLYCYANQNIDSLIDFWSKTTAISKEQFTKPYVRKDFDLQKIDKMKYGLLHVRYYDKKLLNLIRRWIREYIDKFAQVDP